MKIRFVSSMMLGLLTSVCWADVGTWKSDHAFDQDFRLQYWNSYRDALAAGQTPGIITVNLTGNYLLTRRHEFGRWTRPDNHAFGSNDYPSLSAFANGAYDGGDQFPDGSDAFLPWKNVRIVAGPANASDAWGVEKLPVPGVAPAGEDGRIVAGFRVPRQNADHSSNWNYLAQSSDSLSVAFYNRIPAGSRDSVYWIDLANYPGPVIGKNNPNHNVVNGSDQGHDPYYLDEFGNKLRIDTAWPAAHPSGNSSIFVDSNQQPTPFDPSVPLTAAIGDQQLTFATESLSLEASGRFRYGFVDSPTAQTPASSTVLYCTDQNALTFNEVAQLNLDPTTSNLVTARYDLNADYPHKATQNTPADPPLPQSDIRCTLFGYSEYGTTEVGVSGMQEVQPLGTQPRVFKVTLDQNPFSILTNTALNLDGNQRFRVWNAPEFLDQAGEMVLDKLHKRLYFIPFGGVDSGGPSVIPDSDNPVGPNQTLFVGLSQTAPSGDRGTLSNPPLTFNACQNVTLKNFYFRTIPTEGIRAGDCDNLLVQDCLFESVGQNAVSLDNCTNTRVTRCGFNQGLGGYVHITQYGQANYKGTHAVTSNLDPHQDTIIVPSEDFLKLVDHHVQVDSCSFAKNGQLYPAVPAISIDTHVCGVTIGGSTNTSASPAIYGGNLFRNLTHSAVGYGGLKIKILNNDIKQCCTETADSAAIYTGRSWIEVGNVVDGNRFEKCNRYDTDPATLRPFVTDHIVRSSFAGTTHDDDPQYASDPTALLSYGVETAGIMLDDFQVGQVITNNQFTQCAVGIVSNGGRYNYFWQNGYHDESNPALFSKASRKFRAAVASRTSTGDLAGLMADSYNEVFALAYGLWELSGGGNSFNPSTSTLLNPWQALEGANGNVAYTYPNAAINAHEIRSLVSSCLSGPGVFLHPFINSASSDSGQILTNLQNAGYFVKSSTAAGATFAPTPYTNPSTQTLYYWLNNRANLISSPYLAWTAGSSQYRPLSWSAVVGAGNIGTVIGEINFYYGYISNPMWVLETGGGGEAP